MAEAELAAPPVMQRWRNRYTRTFEGRMGKPVWVQIPPAAIYKGRG